jgi:hypothetical protein
MVDLNITALPTKTAPISTDTLILIDSAATNALKNSTVAQIVQSVPPATHSQLATTISDFTTAARAATTQQAPYQTIAYATTITPDASAGRVITVGTLTGDITIATPTNPAAGMYLTFILTQDATGKHAVTWSTAYKLATFNVAQGANAVSVYTFIYNGTNWLQDIQYAPFPVTASTVTFDVDQHRTILVNSTSNSVNVRLPYAVNTLPGREFRVKWVSGANVVTVTAQSGSTIDGASTYTIPTINSSVTVESDGTAYYIL